MSVPVLPPLPASVYEPSDDSFLFLDVLEDQRSFLTLFFAHRSAALVTLELGGGSGVLSAALLSHISGAFHLVIDINPEACATCQATMVLNQVAPRSQIIQGDLAACVQPGTIDVLLFNPPYVPTDDDELSRADDVAAAWAGGHLGRRVLDRLLAEQLDALMTDKAVVYILAVEDNRPQEIMAQLRAMRFRCDIVMQRKARNERLLVIRAQR